MIVAVATENNMVAQHFGRCPEYTIFGIDDGRIVEQNVIANPGHEPGFLPRYLADMSVKYVIAGGMGPRAQSLFSEQGIETHVGVSGPLNEVIEAFIEGSLQSGISTCEHSKGGHSCD